MCVCLCVCLCVWSRMLHASTGVTMVLVVLLLARGPGAAAECENVAGRSIFVSSQSQRTYEIFGLRIDSDDLPDVVYRQGLQEDIYGQGPLRKVWWAANQGSAQPIPRWGSATEVDPEVLWQQGMCAGHLGTDRTSPVDVVIMARDPELVEAARIRRCINDGNGAFTCDDVGYANETAAGNARSFEGCVFGNFTGDPYPDILFVVRDSDNMLFTATGMPGKGLRPLEGVDLGFPHFNPVASYDVVDLDSDGFDDVIATARGGSGGARGQVYLLENMRNPITPVFNFRSILLAEKLQQVYIDAQLADISGDGLLDLVTMDVFSGITTFKWWEATDANLTLGVGRDMGTASTGDSKNMAVYDVDNDGAPDVVFPYDRQFVINWFRNEVASKGVAGAFPGEGEGRVMSEFCPLCNRIALADLNLDGSIDFVATIGIAGKVVAGYNLLLTSVLDTQVIAPSLLGARQVIPVTWNEDLLLDLVIASHEDVPLVVATPRERQASLFDISVLATKEALGSGVVGVNSVVALDGDGDEHLDIVASVLHEGGGTSLSLILHDSTPEGVIPLVPLSANLGISPSSIVAVDLTGPLGLPDAHWDVVVATQSGQVVVVVAPFVDSAGNALLSLPTRQVVFDGPGVLANTSSPLGLSVAAALAAVGGPGGPESAPPVIVVEDMNGDGVVDVVGSSLLGANETLILWGPVYAVEQATVLTAIPVPPGLGSRSGLAVGDMDGDGDLDVVVATATSLAWFNASGGGSYDPILVEAAPVFVSDPKVFVGMFDALPGMDISVEYPVEVTDSPYGFVTWSWDENSASGFVATRPNVVPPDFQLLARADMDGNAVADPVSPLSSALVWVPATTATTSVFPVPPRTIPVDVVRYGYTVRAIVEAMAKASSCSADVVVLPPGEYTRCLTGDSLVVDRSVTLRSEDEHSPSAIRCEGKGHLFTVQDGKRLTLSNLVVSGLTARGSTLRRSAGLQVSGVGSLLVLDRVVLENCANVGVFTDLYAGSGGGVLVLDGGRVEVDGCEFRNNVAQESGGAIAVFGQSSSASISRSVFVGNRALTGRGGSLYISRTGERQETMILSLFNVTVRDSDSMLSSGGGICLECDISSVSPLCAALALLEDLEVSGCSAESGWGGGLAVLGRGVNVTLRGSLNLWDNRAKYGGGLGVTEDTGNVDARDDVGDPNARSRVEVEGVLEMASNVGLYGGSISVCRVAVALNNGTSAGVKKWENGTAEVAGPGYFGCVPFGLEEPLSTARVESLPWLEVREGGGGGLETLFGDLPLVRRPPKYGGLVATPPATLRRVGVGELGGGGLVVTSGTRLELGELDYVVEDGFGQRVVDSSVEFGAAVVDDGGNDGEVSGGESVPRPDESGEVTFAGFVLRARSSSFRGDAVEDEDGEGGRVGFNMTVFAVETPSVSARVDVEVRPCGLGQGGARTTDDEYLSCGVCPAGTYSDEVGTGPCLLCGGFSVAVGAVECPACGTGSSPDVENALSNKTVVCLCRPGFYGPSPRPADGACEVCPLNGVCQGKESWPLASPGYFDVSAEPGVTQPEFVVCRVPSSCKGGRNECARGFTGFLCGSCETEFYRDSSGACVACPSSSAWLFATFVLLAFGLVIATVLVLGYLTRPNAEMQSTSTLLQRRVSRIPVSFAMAVVFCQIVATFGTALYEWPSEASSALGVLSFANVDTNWAANECTLTSFVLKFVLVTVFPLLLGVFFVGSLFVFTQTPYGSHLSMGDGLRAAFVTVGPLLYFPLSRSTLAYFDCVSLPGRDGELFLDGALSVRCFHGDWWIGFPVALVGLVLYVAGIPLGIAKLLYSVRYTLDDPHVLAVLGPVYKKYRGYTYMFEVVQMGKRLAIAFASLFLSHTPALQLVTLLSLLGVFSVVLSRTSPYFLPLYNRLEIQLNVVLIAILSYGFVFLSGSLTSDGTRTFVIVLVIATVVVALVLLGHASYLELRLLSKVRSDPRNEEVRNVREAYLARLLAADIKDWEEPSRAKAALMAYVGAAGGGAASGAAGGGGGGKSLVGGDLGGMELDVL